ncbi:MAG TPA: NAD-glutamate dehydrogenase [Stellaceae bacterium]|nr:NAD-glutamate dehydrogenase [Stellaceae bacterium]
MAIRADDAKHAKIEEVARLAVEAAGDRGNPDLLRRFVEHFYRHVAPAEILARSPEALTAAVLSLWRFGGERQPTGQKLGPKLRLTMPELPAEEAKSAARPARSILEIVNDDMPFLVDSVTGALAILDIPVSLVIHPVLSVERDAQGRLTGLPDAPATTHSANTGRESFMCVELGRALDADLQAIVLKTLGAVLDDVRLAVADWQPMRGAVERIAAGLAAEAALLPETETAEVAAFLDWLADDNFTFLGYREYRLDGAVEGLSIEPGAGLGLLRDDAYSVFDGLRNFTTLSPEVQEFVRSPQLVLVTKANRLSTIHRTVPLDVIIIKRFSPTGEVVGQRLVLGLFTSTAYNRSPRVIPVVRRKVQRVVERSGIAANSHDGKTLAAILENYPTDELFQVDETELFETAMGILHLQERQRIALFARDDPFERFVSCLVFVPRDRYSTALKDRMAEILADAYDGTITSAQTQLAESVLARLHFIVQTTPGQVPDVDPAQLEQRLVEAGRDWTDRLRDALADAAKAAGGDAAEAEILGHRFGDAFPSAYKERFSVAVALADIAQLGVVQAGAPIALTLAAEPAVGPAALTLKLFHAVAPVALSDVLPMLENLGVKVITEIPFQVAPADTDAVWIQQFELEGTTGPIDDFDRVRGLFEAAFRAVWSGDLENDGFNRLVLSAGLGAREITILRAYCKILRQAGSSFSQAYMEDTLGVHAGVALLLVKLFEAQFDPHAADEARAASFAQRIEAALDDVANLDEDRILRSFLLLVRKSLRTNFYQRDAAGQAKSYLSIKLASQEIDLLPLPRPLVEIYVYSPRIEGVHLRGGKAARGGIRWSDRKEDFRTEILGLMKAQMVKNAVIVPVGSKGGFVVKRPPATGGRAALMDEVVACYKTLMSGLLDLTDNIVGDGVMPPVDVVRRDGDDTYLVVAADKGTATFSDIANGVAIDYGFWLGDAFASGGSIGYDHKAMGITARGAWEAVKRHFRELGTDIQTTDFTVLGIGDMSGDVFGNGMLLSPRIRLVGTFNHQHIFLDPAPDTAASFAERRRLFDNRLGWGDYDRALIAKGGGIYDRSMKTIPLSAEIRALLGLTVDEIDPAALIQAMLRAPVDLLWFGGIGSYVKASDETHADAGDRTNDALRVDATSLRAKVLGEGANLAVTQRARIEFALAGGRINTDAIDNSAGVDTSDHEVNIKIAVGAAVLSGALAAADRPAFLASMTDEVASLVLEDNIRQTLAITLAEADAVRLLDQQVRLMRFLEKSGRLDRAIEFLPDDETLAERAAARRGLVRPEIAVLLAYAKNALYAELLPSDLPDEAELEADLLAYFPTPLVERFRPAIEGHRLRREIIATYVTNELVNRMGPTFASEVQAATGRGPADLARAYRIARDVLQLPRLWAAVDELDNQVAASAQIELLQAIGRVAERATLWFLRSGLPLDISRRIAQFAPGVATMAAALGEILPATETGKIDVATASRTAAGVPALLARRVGELDALGAAMDIVRIDETRDVVELARSYFAAGERLGLAALRDAAARIPTETSWQRLAVATLIDDFFAHQRDIVQRVLAEPTAMPASALADWLAGRGGPLVELDGLLADLAKSPDLALLTVADRQLSRLIGP